METTLISELDFNIYEDGDSKTLIFIDKSDYCERPSNPIVEVKFPSLSQTYSYIITPLQLNVLTTKNLKYSDCKIDFSDGIYNIKYSISPNSEIQTCKNYLKTSLLECKIKKLLEKELTSETINDLYELDMYLIAAKYLVNVKKEQAMYLFELVTKKLNKLDCGL